MSGNFDKDFYKVLGVAENASADEIKRAYRTLARKHHPDRNPDSKSSEETMKKISEANDVVSDPKKRAEYDQARKMARSGAFRAPGGTGHGGGVTVNGEAADFDLGDIFGSIFGGRGGRRAGRSAPRSVPKGQDLQTEARISFDDAVRGSTITMRLQRDVACGVCAGTGAQPGSAVSTCADCNGLGVTGDDQGYFSFQRPCTRCSGTGRIAEHPCMECSGDGVVRKPQDVKVRIPAGIRDGAKIRVKAKGGPAPRDGEPGDLFVVVAVGAHPVFGRSGADLIIDLPLTYPEAALGAEIAIPTLDGSVTLKIPAGTQPGRTFRVKGRGAAKPNGGRGDLLATVRVVVPESLGEHERAALNALKDVQNGSVRAHFATAEQAGSSSRSEA